MAAALVGGMLQNGTSRADVRVIDVSESARARFAEMGIRSLARWDQQTRADVVVFAVKPQQMKEAAGAVRPAIKSAMANT